MNQGAGQVEVSGNPRRYASGIQARVFIGPSLDEMRYVELTKPVPEASPLCLTSGLQV